MSKFRAFIGGLSATIALLAVVALTLAAPAAHAAGVRAVVSANVQGSYFGTNALGAVQATFNQAFQYSFTEGVAANQADKLFSDSRTLAASATENLDLAGVLTDPFGSTLTFVTIKAIIIQASSANTNDVVVGGAASNTFTGMFGDPTDKISVRPGGVFVWVAPATGNTVTATTGDILKVANSSSGTGVTYKVIIIGTSS